MMNFLLDTNVISEQRKRNPDKQAKAWADRVSPSSLFLSTLVVGEIRQGIERLRSRDPLQASLLDNWLGQVETGFGDRILPVTTDIAHEWGRMHARTPLPVVDGLLAATAKVHGLTLVTRNVADVVRSGASILNPFEA